MKGIYFFLLYILWPLIYPLSNGLAPIFSSTLRARKKFEERNAEDPLSQSFAVDGKEAQILFEVSSEGELEQVRPIIKELLRKGILLELVICSPSVEKNSVLLAKDHPHHLRLLRWPLLTYFPGSKRNLGSWATAKNVILCRYDFFPEMILYGQRQGINFHLVSATLKNRLNLLNQPLQKNLAYFYWKSIYTTFDSIVAASQKDQQRLIEIFNISADKIQVFDFRILQIHQRLLDKEKTLQTLPNFSAHWLEYLQEFPREKRLILGSFWSSEVDLLANSSFQEKIRKGELQLTILPHLLSDSSFKELLKRIAAVLQNQLPLYQIGPEELQAGPEVIQNLLKKAKENPGIFVLGIRGILCELYSYYQHAFVGGGHGRSIHSVLEPYLGMTHIYIGPKVFRSTEYDFICEHSPSHVHIVNQLSQFYPLFQVYQFHPIDEEKRRMIAVQARPVFQQFMERTLRGIHAKR